MQIKEESLYLRACEIVKCCHHSCPRNVRISIVAFGVHGLMHIVAAVVLYRYAPNKYVFYAIAALDAASHYLGIIAFVSFAVGFLKKQIFKLKYFN